ncbi:hypothetical protein OIE62_07015 [Streptomyces scopuliridis]|uniref:Uncharacterized protein n=1 Tax=Streptomyces scopuliridis TaxID=452529 RepID=A0ACD4ZUQ2_9ACTN|nr:hypothetical protein [Streptomyces scopuliridis]WSC01674.1 hypothetical protein OG835_34805 [Streptomyces scopuliridis]WSC04787.1 hypothetical protein OIE62_07015 [Streptomyces scopuliridis]
MRAARRPGDCINRRVLFGVVELEDHLTSDDPVHAAVVGQDELVILGRRRRGVDGAFKPSRPARRPRQRWQVLTEYNHHLVDVALAAGKRPAGISQDLVDHGGNGVGTTLPGSSGAKQPRRQPSACRADCAGFVIGQGAENR